MLKAIDSTTKFIRSIVSLAVVGVVGAGGWIGYTTYYANDLAIKERDRQLEERDRLLEVSQVRIGVLKKDVALKQQEIERLDMAVRLLKRDRRVAQIDQVVKRRVNGSGELQTDFTFVEVDKDGQPLEEPRTFTIDGDEVHIDALVVKFLDEHIEQADPLRGASMVLFRRIHGGSQAPDEAFPLDAIGQRPAAYAEGPAMSDTEREIWSNFWDYALDEAKREGAGVRAAHGQTNYTRLMEGKRYKLSLRASDGLTITTEDVPPAASRPAS